MKKFFLIIAIIILPLNKIYGENRSLKFIALGHIYPIINDEIRMNSLFKKINSHSADYVFVLGDSKLNEKKYYKYLNKNINSKLFFSPGNHDISGKKIENYKKNVGYMNSSFEDLGVKFILVNSSQSKNDLLNYLKKNLKDNFNGLTIILTHHRIWDDTLMSNAPYEHDKSYFFEDIYPIIKDKVDVIIAGNSKRQHFRDLMDDEFSFGKQNVNLIYWLDKIGDIELYAVGMGDGKPKANFIVAEIKNYNGGASAFVLTRQDERDQVDYVRSLYTIGNHAYQSNYGQVAVGDNITESNFDDGFSVVAPLSDGNAVIAVTLPAVISCDKGNTKVRKPNVKGIMQAKRANVDVRTCEVPISSVNVVSQSLPAAKPAGKKFEGGQNASEVARLLRDEANII